MKTIDSIIQSLCYEIFLHDVDYNIDSAETIDIKIIKIYLPNLGNGQSRL